MKDNNLALLSQKEIDTLLQFIRQQNEDVAGQVLNQNSIDKLVYLLSNIGADRYKYEVNTTVNAEDKAAVLQLDKTEPDLQLVIGEPNNKGYIEIYATNLTRKIRITPKSMKIGKISEADDSEWGYFIPPIVFDQLAAMFGVRYTQETYDKVCRHYAEKVYGDENHIIPDLFLPVSEAVLEHIMLK